MILRRIGSPREIQHDQLRPRKRRSDLRLAVYVAGQSAGKQLSEQRRQSAGDDDHQSGEQEHAARTLELRHQQPSAFSHQP